MRKRYTPAFKAQIVQEMLREQKSVAQLAAEHGVHSTMLYEWRDQALQAPPNAFTDWGGPHLLDHKEGQNKVGLLLPLC